MKLGKRIFAVTLTSVVLTSSTVYANPGITSAPKTIKAYVGDKVELKYGFSYEYSYQKIIWNMTDFFGKSIMSRDDEITESQAIKGEYSYMIDTKSMKAGTYKINAHVEWYTFHQWHRDFGEANTSLVLIEKPKYAVTISQAKNVKPKKIKVIWKKMQGATKYQVKIGSKKYTTTKTGYTKKNLKKGKSYTVNVRAYVDGKWRNWAINKKVKVTK